MATTTIRTLAAVGVVFAATPALADWKADWDKTVAAANAEGELVMNSQPNKAARSYILAEWAKAYPNIKLSLSVVSSRQFVVRIRTERAAGQYLWDLAQSGASTGYALYKEGTIAELRPWFILPDVADPATWGGWDRVFFDKARKYVFAMSATLKSPFYNTAHVTQAEVDKQKLKLLLDPKYKGKFVWHDPTRPGSGQSFGYLLRKRLGDDGLRKLLTEQQAQIVPQQQMVVEGMARETAWIGLGPLVGTLIKPYLKAGVTVSVRAFGNDPEMTEMSIAGAGLYVFDKPPHPNATKVFVNWILSKDVQYGLAKVMLQDSRRLDLPSVAEPERVPIKGAQYIETQREDYLADVQAASKFIAGIRKGAR